MTTVRPYSGALSIEAATNEIRAGRGTQFAPAVVDAFFTALRRQPADFTGEDPSSPAAVRLTAS